MNSKCGVQIKRRCESHVMSTDIYMSKQIYNNNDDDDDDVDDDEHL